MDSLETLISFLATPMGVAVFGGVIAGIFAITGLIWRLNVTAIKNQANLQAHKDRCDERAEEVVEKIDKLHDKVDRLTDAQHDTHVMVVETVAHSKQHQLDINRLMKKVYNGQDEEEFGDEAENPGSSPSEPI